MLKVSIIITTHNRPHLFPRAVESARAASRRAVEVVVVDDASDEDTARVCRGLKDVRYVRVENNEGVVRPKSFRFLLTHAPKERRALMDGALRLSRGEAKSRT